MCVLNSAQVCSAGLQLARELQIKVVLGPISCSLGVISRKPSLTENV